MAVTISLLLTNNKGHGVAKNLVLSLNLYHPWRYLAQLVWNVHIEKKRINNFIFIKFKTTG